MREEAQERAAARRGVVDLGDEHLQPRLVRADESGFVEAVGERMALLGDARGRLEVWMWPVLLFHDLALELRAPDGNLRAPGARTVTVVPEGLALSYEHEGVTLSVEAFCCRAERGLVLLLDHDGGTDLELGLSFQPALRPMWPASLGGQIGGTDAETGAYSLSEELGRFAALVGGPGARVVRGGSERGTRERVTLALTLPPRAAREGPVPVLVAGAQRDPDPLPEEARRGGRQSARGTARAEAVLDEARAAWRALEGEWPEHLAEQRARWSAFLARTARLSTSDARLDAAFLWSKVAIQRAWARVDGVGRSLVAGLGPASGGDRPGFAWFFGGDALVATRALTGLGDFEAARAVLRWVAGTQRADGKLAHEVTLAAGLCDWYGDYPYAYYKGQVTPGFVSCLAHHVAATDDTELAKELWPHAVRALAWCEATCDDAGRMRVPEAGIAAVEAGPLANRIETELYLHGIWLSALRGGLALAARREDEGARAALERLLARAEDATASFWEERHGRFAFAHLEGGARCTDLSAYLALLVSREDGARARATAGQLNRPELAADWGTRMFATDSAVYEPGDYNTGAVFPYLTGFSVLALYRHRLAAAAHQLLYSQVELDGFGGLGYLPEHLAGDRARLPARSVPHQVFSQTTIVQGVLFGMLGLEPQARAGALRVAPQLPPDMTHVRLDGYRVGGTLLDLELSHSGRRGASRIELRAERRDGPPLDVELACPPAAPSRGRLETVLELAFDEPSEPRLLLPTGPIERGAPSRLPRLSDVQREGDSLFWTLHGLGGTRAALALYGTRPLEVAGARLDGDTLLVDFPPGEGFVEHVVTLSLSPRDAAAEGA